MIEYDEECVAYNLIGDKIADKKKWGRRCCGLLCDNRGYKWREFCQVLYLQEFSRWQKLFPEHSYYLPLEFHKYFQIS